MISPHAHPTPRRPGARRTRAQAESTLDVRLRRLQRLVAQGELAATAVHEISNLQTIVLFNAGLLREQRKDDEVVRKYIDPLLHAASLVATLCNQLRNLARPVEATPQVLDLGEAAQGTCRLLERIISRRLIFEGAASPATVLADPGQIDQILINLVLNARDATAEEGGTITVRVRAGAGPRARHSLEVEDNGSGMTPAVKARLFTKFFTTKEPGRGTGLGLTTVQRMMSELGGRIEVRSRVGHGTRFKLLFPPAAPRPTQNEAAPS